jgi:hypothetical protein
MLLIAEIDERREAGIGLQGDIPALAAVASGRSALGNVFLAAPRDKAVPALAGGDGYLDLVDELRLAGPRG